jgi:prepilin-type N-terminal cleavage/methylation domain-containing protein
VRLPRAHGSRAGFTLAEVLVSLVIMSLILVSITMMLHSARRTRDMIHNLQENQLAGPAMLDLIERDLRGLFVFDRRAAEFLRVENRVRAGRDADSLDFVTSNDGKILHEIEGSQQRSNTCEVGYRLRPNPEDDDFLELWRRESFGVDEDPFSGGRFTFLHDRVKDFDIQIFTELGPDAEPLESWGEEGGENVGLPLRIEIELTLELRSRLTQSQLQAARVGQRTMTYRRIIGISQSLRLAQAVRPVPLIPAWTEPSAVGGAAPEGAAPGGPGLQAPPEGGTGAPPIEGLPGSGTTTTGEGADLGEILRQQQ